MLEPEFELRLFREEARLHAQLGESRDVEPVVRAGLRSLREFLEADAACVAELDLDAGAARPVFELPERGAWDLDLLTAFLRLERPAIPATLMLAPLRRRERSWRVYAVSRKHAFEAHERDALARIAATITEIIARVDRERIAEVRARIDRKIMEMLRPKDLFYQILDGLRTLTSYDHSAAVFVAEPDGETLELVAEQIAWRKARSERIGLRIGLEPAVSAALATGMVLGFDRRGRVWQPSHGDGPTRVADLLDDDEPGDGQGMSMICAPIAAREGLIGVLKIASRHAGTLAAHEAVLVQRFLPQVAVAMRNSRRAENLEAQVLQAAKENAMADLARSVAHDVNNALGAILPLVQQIGQEVRAGTLDRDVLMRDLADIEVALGACRRIFGGMLAFARGAARTSGPVAVARALENARSILAAGMERRGIRCLVDVDPDLPAVRGRDHDLEQLFLNLLTNARDAMPEGGEIAIRAAQGGGGIEVTIRDCGAGIPEPLQSRIWEPFFTTKSQGSGLGLAICRSIVWEMRGDLAIESREGQGTTVRIRLPVPAEHAAAGAH